MLCSSVGTEIRGPSNKVSAVKRDESELGGNRDSAGEREKDTKRKRIHEENPQKNKRRYYKNETRKEREKERVPGKVRMFQKGERDKMKRRKLPKN